MPGASIADLCNIRGHVALVTGGTLGIGLACAERFAAEGARVAVVSRDQRNGEAALERLKTLGGVARFFAGDCLKAGDVDPIVAKVAQTWGRIDILVNCVGGFYASPRLDKLEVAEWRQGLEWNLTAKFIAIKAVVPFMKERGYGRIVNVASIAGRTGIVAAPLDYSAAKAGVIGLTRRLAGELAPFGITANVAAPGTTLSPRIARLSERRLEQIRQNIPVGRIASPEEIAHGIWYLCTPGAGFVTGAVLDMNGGVWTG